jgi:hypothetical protein
LVIWRPEQVNGRPLDRRADIYAVGVVLYETLTGERPFTGRDFSSTALMHVTAPVPDPRVLRPEIPNELAAIVARALEKRPKDRYPTARAMADALLSLPIKRAMPREAAAWLAETAREFFSRRDALIAALPSVGRVTTETTTIANDEAPKTEVSTRLILTAPRPEDHVDARAGDDVRARLARLSFAMTAMIFFVTVARLLLAANRFESTRPAGSEAAAAPPPSAASSARATTSCESRCHLNT